jgi:hypothetical protein
MSSTDEIWARQAIRRFVRLLCAVTALLLATEIAALLQLIPHLVPLSLHALLTNPLFAIGFGCPLVLHLSRLPSKRELAATLVAAIVASLLVGVLAAALTALQMVIGLGIGSALVLAWRARSTDDGVRREALLFLLPSLVALIFTLEVAMFLDFISRYRLETFDSFAYVVDASFGSAISFDVGRLFRQQPIVAAICTFIYLAPPPALIFVYALQVKRRPHPPVDVVTLLLLMGGIGYALYFLFPVAGPKFAFASFPTTLPILEKLIGQPMFVPPAPRNGVPSLHMASALIAFTYARRYGKWAGGIALIFVVGTLLATMGVGEHYFFDLIVALPFTAGAHAALIPGLPWKRRSMVVVPAALIFFGWLWMARFEGATLLRAPSISWTALLCTVIAYVLAERILAPGHVVIRSRQGLVPTGDPAV